MMKILLLALSALVLISCNKKSSDDSVTSGETELTPFVGKWKKCQAVSGKGTEFPSGNSSYYMELTVNANGTFTHDRWYYGDSATCTGTLNIISWSESGTVDVIRDSSSVPGAKEIKFDRTSSYVTPRDTGGLTFNTRFGTYYNPPISGTVTNPTSIALNNAGSAFSMGDFVINLGITYNTISVSGATLSMHDPLDWNVGQISAPASQGFNMTKI